jgi:hypothetical protein
VNFNHPILRNAIGIITGILIGGSVNMAIIMSSSAIIPPPTGANLTTEAGLIAAMPLMKPIHFLMPFLAHAFGTFVGALIASLIAKSKQFILSMVIGLQFFIGGAMMVYQLPSPLWFNITDLVGAYFPFALFGYWMSNQLKNR